MGAPTAHVGTGEQQRMLAVLDPAPAATTRLRRIGNGPTLNLDPASHSRIPVWDAKGRADVPCGTLYKSTSTGHCAAASASLGAP